MGRIRGIKKGESYMCLRRRVRRIGWGRVRGGGWGKVRGRRWGGFEIIEERNGVRILGKGVL